MTDDSSNISRANNRRFAHKVSKQWVVVSGDCSPSMQYLASKSYNSCFAPLKFLDALFRGYGQVVFANNPISGVIIFIALTIGDPQVSGAGLLAASVGLLTSIVVIPQSEDIINNGLTVFNPLLIGLVTTTALPQQYGIELEYWHFFFIILASIISVYVASALGNILGAVSRYPLPYLTMPFNVVQQLLFLILISANAVTIGPHVVNVTQVTSLPVSLAPESLVNMERMVTAPIEKYTGSISSKEMSKLSNHTTLGAAYVAVTYGTDAILSNSSQQDITSEGYSQYLALDGTMDQDKARIERSVNELSINISRGNDEEVDWGGVFPGIVLSASQVYAFNYAPTAVLIYLAILIYSPITAAFALLGATMGTLTGVFLTDPISYSAPGGVYDGSWGFNGSLCTMCLGGLFFVLSWSSALAAVLCAIFATVVQYLLMSPFAQASLVPMSLPFNLSALLFLCVTTSRALVRPQTISFPEKQRLEHKENKLSQVQRSSSLDDFNKDSENEKKPALAEVV